MLLADLRAVLSRFPELRLRLQSFAKVQEQTSATRFLRQMGMKGQINLGNEENLVKTAPPPPPVDGDVAHFDPLASMKLDGLVHEVSEMRKDFNQIMGQQTLMNAILQQLASER